VAFALEQPPVVVPEQMQLEGLVSAVPDDE